MKARNGFLIGVIALSSLLSFSQSNDCSTATTLPVTANCSSPTAGTTAGATQSIAGCSGTADDDVWYQFTATATTHQINLTSSATFDAVVQVFSGTCASLTSLSCTDIGFAGDNETCYLSGLTIGQVYKIRVYHYGAGSASATFTICCTVGASVPANNNCSGATPLTVNASCVTTAGTTLGATQSSVGCAGTADDDVWYSFVATNATQTITVTPTTSSFDAVFQVYSGTCAALVSEACIDQTLSNQAETSAIIGLTPGQTYYVRVYDYYSANPGTFTICVTGTATATPTNDNPCSAIALPPVTSNCNYLEFTTVGATNTAVPGAPSACAGGSGAMQGGFSAGTLDVWFSITVPASGNLYVTPKPNMGAGRISDGVMVLYSGTCGSLTQISCSDDNNFPGSGNDLLPFIGATGLTPGATVYLRFFGYGTTSGTFGLCVTTASNDACSNALYICDLNGYSASTSAAFTPDRPCNMRGNAEQNNAPTYTYTPGINQGGIFGSAGAWGSGSASPDVQINNNSWIRFTAAATTAVLNVNVIDCWVGNYPSGGIQMQIFSSNGACCNFTPVSNFEENSSNFTITANSLTPGNDYYLMVDGFAGDICNYTITAQSGVQFPEITPVGPICTGQSVVLTAPAGASSYDWDHNGATTQSVSVTPPTTQTYSVDVYGICGYKQTLTTTVTVNPIPVAPNVGSNQTLCTGNTLNLTSNFVSGATYSWTGPNSFTSSAQNPSISNITTAMAGTYTCTVTVNGCTSPGASTVVTINSTPAAPIISSNSPVCSGQTINLFSNTIGSASYLWSGPSSFTSTLEDPTRPTATAAMAGIYTCQVTVNGCPNSATTNVVVNPTPASPVAGSNSPLCVGQTINLTASNVAGATSYAWTGPNSFSSTSQNPSLPATVAASGTYTVTATGSGCTSVGATVNVVVNPIPATPVVSSNSPVCVGQTINLTSNTIPTATYAWSGPSSFTSTLEDPTRGSAVVGYSGIYSLTVTVNGCASSAATTNVVVNPIPASPTAGSNSPVCSGNAINLTATTVPSATSYTWSGPLSYSSSTQNPTISNSTTAMSGTYSVTATVNGCASLPGTVNVVVNATPATPTPTSNSPICEGSTINLSQPLIGGATYAWTGPNSFSSSAQNPSIPNGQAINAGTYNLTVTVSGCTSASASTSVAVNTAATVDAGSNLASCNGAPVSLGGSFGGSSSSVTWSNGAGGFSNINSPTSTYTPSAGEVLAGSVTLTLTSDNPTGPCPTASDVVTITISSSPSATFSYPAPLLCQNGSDPSPIFPMGSSGGIFSAGAGLSINSTTGIIDLSASTPGIYTVNNFIAANGSCPSASANTSFEVIATPATPSASNNGLICENGAISLTTPLVSGATYSWTGPNGFSSSLQNPTINPAGSADAGTYLVTITVNGCTSSDGTTTVVITPNPVVSIANANPTSVCLSETIDLIAQGADTYVWSTTESAATITVGPTTTSTYTVVGTTNGCSASAQVDVVVNTPASIVTPPSAAQTNCDSPTGSLTGITVSGTANFSYLWTDASNNNVGVGSDLLNVSAGTYTVEVTDGNGCVASFGPYTVSNFPNPTAPSVQFDDASPCIDNGVTGTASFISGATYSWTGPNGYTGSGQSVSINPVLLTNTGTYCVTATVNGCPSSPACTDLTVNSIPVIDISATNNDTVVCVLDLVSLTASGGSTYNWTGPNGFSATGSQVTINGTSANQTGYYTVIGMSGANCSSEDSIFVTINDLPTITVGSDVNPSGTYCSGSSAILTVTGGGNYSWTGPNAFTSINDSITFNPTSVNDAGWYIVSVTDINGCSASDSLELKVQNADFGGTSGNTNLCPGETLQLTATGGTSYQWTGPNSYSGTTANVTIPSMNSAASGTYIVQITDSLGCIAFDTTDVSIVITAACLTIPELVTPDGNNSNDTWDIPGLSSFPDAQVDIFNRWGNLVYSVSPYTTPWAGEINEGLSIDGSNGKVPLGTYFYLIRLNDDENTEYKGYVELQY